ncbi:Sentrin-specific protease 1 [Frankliniella fusca]|uniref:Sentrin-specific protease 1 n=1 Tax=Frankliniella fusca TaxID=407009 RepID=A0AAE1HD03_9NEOP|nr:Sentrin-specific protease 1 [Frankliniella fusca]
MGIWSTFYDFYKFLLRHRDSDDEIESSRKRRGDEIHDMPENKLRCVESPLFNGEAHSLIYDSGSRQKDRSSALHSPQLREQVYISRWNHNGKENCHDFHPIMKNHSMERKHSMDDIQILEEHNFRPPKKGQRGLPFKTACSNGPNNVVQCTSPQSSKDVEIVQILQSPRVNRNEVKTLPSRTPASRDERVNRSSHTTNKPFKATDLPSSTPIIFSDRRSTVHSPEEPEIEVLPSSSMGSGVSRFPYRNQNSLVLADSLNTQRSSNCSTLYHCKRVEEEEAYSKLFEQCCGVERPMKMSSPKSPEILVLDDHRSRSVPKSSFRSPIKSRVHHSSPMAERGKRITVPVEIEESEPSTSASRQQIEDQDLQFLGQVQRPEPVKFTTPDVLEEIRQKYADKEKRMEEIKAEEKKCRLLSERNRHAEVQRRVNIEKEILEQIEAFLHITEEIPQEVAPSLPVLTEEMEAEIDKALGAHPDAVLATAFNLSIKGRDMRTLKPLAWLNDEVINFYMNLLIERGKSDNYPSVHAFNTFFFPKLSGSGYDSLKRWTRKVDIFSHDFILVPIHRGMHWCMAIINMKEKVICYYDSMDGRFPQCADALLNYLQKESMDKKKQPFDTAGWKKEHAENIPQQNNGSDCGMFACMYAEYVSRNAPISFTQDDMPYFRRKVVYEILKAKLLT